MNAQIPFGTLLQIMLRRPKTIITSIRHPAFTPESRLVTGDLVGNALESMAKIARLGGEMHHHNLIWEAHKMGSPTVTGIKWQLPLLFGKAEVTFHSGLATIPWWLTGLELAPQINAVVNDTQKWHELEKSLTESLQPELLIKRMSRIQAVYEAELSDLNRVLSVSSYNMYRKFVLMTLGEHCLPNVKPVPYMSVAGQIAAAKMRAWGQKDFENAIDALCPNGEKNLFLGSLESDPHLLSYIGRSPKKVWVKVVGRTTTGKPVGNPKGTDFDNILNWIEQGTLIPIGFASMLLFLADSTIIHHGAEYGQKEKIAQLGVQTAISLPDKIDSWPFLTLTAGTRNISPGLHEIYLMFGKHNPFVAKILNESLKSKKAVKINLAEALKYAGAGQDD